MSIVHLDQYFTTNEAIQQYVYHIVRGSDTILEPSIGRGHLVASFVAQNAHYPIHGYDIDSTLLSDMVFEIDPRAQIMCRADFLDIDDKRSYSTIIMNPPYYAQGSCKFITKCFREHLADRGEMICVIPRTFLHATHSQQILRDMMSQGRITDIWFPNDEHLFAGATIDIVIFRYERAPIPSGDVLRSGTICQVREGMTNPTTQTRICRYEGGNLQFIDTMRAGPVAHYQIRDMFDIYVGQVSGADKIFAHDSGNIELLVRIPSVTRRFICAIASLDELTPDARQHLQAHRAQLLERKIRAFSDDNWWQWGALRNAQVVRERYGEPCIYVTCRTRQPIVAVVGAVQWFNGSLLCMIPRNDEVDCAQVARYINETLRAQYLSAGRFIITQRVLANSSFVS
ncbi:MAG: hypothetical protein WC919_06580 [Candidatus Paceibacterota bacterium]|jgi:hypothetical protein